MKPVNKKEKKEERKRKITFKILNKYICLYKINFISCVKKFFVEAFSTISCLYFNFLSKPITESAIVAHVQNNFYTG